MRIVLGGDHRGLSLKQAIAPLIVRSGHSCEDVGCYRADPVDYPDVARKVAEAVASGEFDYGILICDTGIGMSIAANKVRGVRAALCHDAFTAARSRHHNDANILCLAAGGDLWVVADIIGAFLSTEFEGGRHQRRLDKVKAMEG